MHTSNDRRFDALKNWLETVLKTSFDLTPITGDASFRRYFRLSPNGSNELINNALHAIVMDAPPPQESIEPFYSLGQQLFDLGVNVPNIYASDEAQGFLLLEDFGNQQMLEQLDDTTSDALYTQALSALVHMQTCANDVHVPEFSHDLLMREMNLFTDWLLKTHLNICLNQNESDEIQTCFKQLTQSALQQPQIFVHRDYHSRNLMMKDNGDIGIIDFQDAVKGPITYDAVSLLRDCYITWPENKVDDWLHTYHRLLVEQDVIDTSLSEFTQWFDLMGIQRHLKASGIFARLYHRDGKTGYLADIPNTVRYIHSISQRYEHTACLARLIETYDIINAAQKVT